MHSFLQRLHPLACVMLSILVTACGGSDDEPRVTMYRTLTSDITYPDGRTVSTLFPIKGSAQVLFERLRSAGLHPENLRCSIHTGLFGGQPVVFVDALSPRFVLVDMPESEVLAAQALHYVRWFPHYETIAQPFKPCSEIEWNE